MSTEWVTYTRPSRHSNGMSVKTTQEANLPVPKGFSSSRPATEDEIQEQLARRTKQEHEHNLRVAFESRSDFKDARAIADALEFMTPEKNPLDKLTPEEWAMLRQKVCG